jgi:hypothetical protein
MALTPDQRVLLQGVLAEFLQLRNPITFMNLGQVLDAMKAAVPEAQVIKAAAITQWLKNDPRAKLVIEEAYRQLYGTSPGAGSGT